MLFGKWDWNVAKEVWQEEAEERGVEKGVAIGEARGMEEILALWESGISLSEAKKALNLKKD